MKNNKLIILNSKIKILIHNHQNENQHIVFKTFADFYNIFLPILNDKNCSFVLSNDSYKKKGHLKATIHNNKIDYEMKLSKLPSLCEMLYIFAHEFTHLINSHPINKDLTFRQKEVVADTVAKMIINSLNLYDELENSYLYKQLQLHSYSIMWIKNGSFSSKKENLVFKQINDSYNYINSLIKSSF